MESRVGGDTPSRRVQSALAGGRGDAIVSVNMTRRRLGAMLLAVAVTSAVPIDPARAQSAAPSFIDFDWIDSARSRAVPARLHWPIEHRAGVARAAHRVLPWHGRLPPGLQLSGPILGCARHCEFARSACGQRLVALGGQSSCRRRPFAASGSRERGACAGLGSALRPGSRAVERSPTAPRSTVGVSWRPAIRMAQTRPFLRSAPA